MEDIEFDKTISRNRIVYKTHWIEFYEYFIQFVIFILFAFISILLFKSQDFIGITTISITILLLIIFSIYKYKKSYLLISIDTGFHKEKNKLLINRVIEQRNFILKFQDNNYLRAISRLNFLFMRHELTVIFADNKVLLNLVISTGLIRFPSIIGLRRFIKEFNESIKAGT